MRPVDVGCATPQWFTVGKRLVTQQAGKAADLEDSAVAPKLDSPGVQGWPFILQVDEQSVGSETPAVDALSQSTSGLGGVISGNLAYELLPSTSPSVEVSIDGHAVRSSSTGLEESLSNPFFNLASRGHSLSARAT